MQFELGKLLIVMGLGVALIGLILVMLSSLKFGKLPGDFVIQRENWTFFFPLGTSLLLSLLLTLFLWLVISFLRK